MEMGSVFDIHALATRIGHANAITYPYITSAVTQVSDKHEWITGSDEEPGTYWPPHHSVSPSFSHKQCRINLICWFQMWSSLKISVVSWERKINKSHE